MQRATGNLDWAGTHMAGVIKEYEADHKEISEPLRDCCQLLVELQSVIMSVRRLI